MAFYITFIGQKFNIYFCGQQYRNIRMTEKHATHAVEVLVVLRRRRGATRRRGLEGMRCEVQGILVQTNDFYITSTIYSSRRLAAK